MRDGAVFFLTLGAPTTFTGGLCILHAHFLRKDEAWERKAAARGLRAGGLGGLIAGGLLLLVAFVLFILSL